MSERVAPKVTKWPFVLGDLLLIALAAYLAFYAGTAGQLWTQVIMSACVALGAWLLTLPFLKDHAVAVDAAELHAIDAAVQKIHDVEAVAVKINNATGQWQMIQDTSVKTVEASRKIAEQITVEARSFAEFMRKTNDTEKAALRLEVEKLRRGEGDWLQIVVRMLDHVHALTMAGQRSGQPQLIEQLGHFQAACRDVARRTGLVPFEVKPGEPFNPQMQDHAHEGATMPPNAVVVQTLSQGFTFQGQLLRKAVVACGVQNAPAPAEAVGQPEGAGESEEAESAETTSETEEGEISDLVEETTGEVIPDPTAPTEAQPEVKPENPNTPAQPGGEHQSHLNL